MNGQRESYSTSTGQGAAFALVDTGLTDYDAVYATQLALVEKKRGMPESLDYLVLCEHPEVYTYGRRSREEVAIVPNAHFIERGGDVTFHNPGQLVGYPILSLREGERDLHKHLRRIEGMLIDTLKEFGLAGERREGFTGVWLQNGGKKIASIGVAVTSWVTYHGFALNVSNDLSGFGLVKPCGLSAEVMTSMVVELGERCPGMSEVKDAVLRHFSAHFGRNLVV